MKNLMKGGRSAMVAALAEILLYETRICGNPMGDGMYKIFPVPAIVKGELWGLVTQ